jgi:hypothetical protein
MSDAIQFYANVDSVQGGDEEVRIVLSVKDTPVDLAAAVGMLGKLNRVLKVSAYLGADSLASFAAAIPQMKTGIQFRKDKSPVIKLDIPASDALSALRLIGYSERVIRFEVEDEGERVGKGRKSQPQPKEPKGPWGKFWRELFLAGFVNCPGVKEAVEGIRETPYEDAWKDLLHRFFGVGGASLAVVSPEDIYAKFPPEQFPAVKTMVEQAKRKAGVN